MKDKILTLRVSEQLMNQIDEKRGEESVSQYIRESLQNYWDLEEDQKNKVWHKEMEFDNPARASPYNAAQNNLWTAIGTIISLDKGYPPILITSEIIKEYEVRGIDQKTLDNMERYERELLFLNYLSIWQERYELSEVSFLLIINTYLTWLSFIYPGPIFSTEDLSLKFIRNYQKHIVGTDKKNNIIN